MAYNRNNYIRRVKRIIEVYKKVKQPDIPDTFIVRNIFPKHEIFISYNSWMNMKGLKKSDFEQELPIAV